MKILIDENMPRMTAAQLRKQGHDVADVRGTRDQGVLDPELWKIPQREKRLLITTDKGFTHYRHERHHGILVVRLRQPNRRRIHEAVLRAFREIHQEAWPGTLVVVRDKARSLYRIPPEQSQP